MANKFKKSARRDEGDGNPLMRDVCVKGSGQRQMVVPSGPGTSLRFVLEPEASGASTVSPCTTPS